MYLAYKEDGDFVGMDMARKFIQMGHTRARRYANYKGGRKYKDKETKELHTREIDEEKAKSAAIFQEKWDLIRADEEYLELKRAHQKQYG